MDDLEIITGKDREELRRSNAQVRDALLEIARKGFAHWIGVDPGNGPDVGGTVIVDAQGRVCYEEEDPPNDKEINQDHEAPDVSDAL